MMVEVVYIVEVVTRPETGLPYLHKVQIAHISCPELQRHRENFAPCHCTTLIQVLFNTEENKEESLISL